MSKLIEYRPGIAADSEQIASLICMAGGGLYEFLFDDLIPFMTAIDFVTMGVAGDDYPISYRNCYVAVDGYGQVIGAANVFPTDLLRDEHYSLLAERQAHIQTMIMFQDWGSMFVNALAVSEECRGYGVGSRLLCWACDRAREHGFDRLSLQVWADNIVAQDFYKASGFMSLGVVDVDQHPRLPHKGAVLMRKMLSLPQDTAETECERTNY